MTESSRLRDRQGGGEEPFATRHRPWATSMSGPRPRRYCGTTELVALQPGCQVPGADPAQGGRVQHSLGMMTGFFAAEWSTVRFSAGQIPTSGFRSRLISRARSAIRSARQAASAWSVETAPVVCPAGRSPGVCGPDRCDAGVLGVGPSLALVSAGHAVGRPAWYDVVDLSAFAIGWATNSVETQLKPTRIRVGDMFQPVAPFRRGQHLHGPRTLCRQLPDQR